MTPTDDAAQTHRFTAHDVRGPDSSTQHHVLCTCGWSYLGVTWPLVQAYILGHVERVAPAKAKSP